MKYYFSVSDGINTLPDQVGRDLTSAVSAREFALVGGRQILQRLKPVIVVTDEANGIVGAIKLDTGSNLMSSAKIEKIKSDLARSTWRSNQCDFLTGLPNRSSLVSTLVEKLDVRRSKTRKSFWLFFIWII